MFAKVRHQTQRAKIKYFYAGILTLMLSSTTFASNEIETRTKYSNAGDEICVVGAFDKPGIANPGESIFNMVETNHTKDRFGSSIYISGDSYTYLGRTGDKTIEIKKRTFTMIPMKPDQGYDIDEVLKLYVDNNAESNLNFISMYTKCGNNNAKLKILGLEGNSLKFKIVLPNCFEQVK